MTYEYRLGEREGYNIRPAMPHPHWSEEQKDQYMAGHSEGLSKRGADDDELRFASQ